MVAHLARCQVDPAAPRVVDRDAAARVRAGAARAPHASGRDQRAGRHARRRAARRRVLRRRGGLDPVHPARLHARQAGRAGRAREPRPAARRAGQARPRGVGRHGRGGVPAHDRGHQPRRRVRQRAHRGRRALRRPRGRARRRRCAPCCPPCAARCRASGTRCSWSTPRRARSSSCARVRAPELVTVGAACPDHLVHTKRVPLWIPFDPASEDADDARRADPRARGGVPRRLPRLRRRRRPSRPTPTRAWCSSSTSA